MFISFILFIGRLFVSFQALPAIVQLMAQRFQREISTSELRLMLLQVFIVILWLNPDRFFQTLNTVAANDPSTQSVIVNFFKQWMADCEFFAGTHDRRICALGLCTLLQIDAKYYSAISDIVPKILPNCIDIYQGLMKTYQHNHEEDNDGGGSGGENSVPSGKTMKIRFGSSRCEFVDIDDGDDEKADEDLIGRTKGKDQEMSGDGLDNDNDDSDFDFDETDLESYSTVLEINEDIDEFQIFCESLQSNFPISSSSSSSSSSLELQMDTTGYNQALLQNLNAEQRTQIQNIIHYTEKRKQEKGKDDHWNEIDADR